MSENQNLKETQRITQFAKNKFSRKYYKDQIDLLDKRAFYNNSLSNFSTDLSDYKRKKINYDLYNNIINAKDFEYVCKPYGSEQGELPANFTNRDIISGKVKALLGMEEKRPFSYKIYAVNDEATTRIEKVEFEKIRDYVVKSIMDPIEAEIKQKAEAETKGKKLTPEQNQQIQQQIAQQTEAMTPQEVVGYMARKHQDPAEALAEQLLTLLKSKLDLKRKFNKGFKHGCISAEEVYHICLENDQPQVNNVNPLFFDCDKSPDVDFVEDGEWAINEYRMSPSKVVSMFNDELTNTNIDDIYSAYGNGSSPLNDEFWDFDNTSNDDTDDTIRVVHAVWKGLRKIGFLTYTDVDGEIQEKLVDESYKKNKELGDLSISWKWIPEVHQGYKIKLSLPIYVKLGPMEGQFKDMDNLHECKLPYVGVVYDNLNSQATSIVDRLKAYQYYYNIVMYRIELLMASDKGKILMMNINTVPKSAGIDIKKWHYYAEATKVAWVNPNEEGNKNIDAMSSNRVLDMSLASDINNYINMATLLERKAGDSVGIYKEVEGQIGASQAVGNVERTQAAASNILEPLFETHNYVKRNVITRLLEVAKEAYSGSKAKMLRYVLDDLSIAQLEMNADMLLNSTYGIFVASSSKAHEAKEMVRQMAHAALQNQMINMSDIIKIIKSDGLQGAEDSLKVAEDTKRKQQSEQQMQIEKVRGEQQEKAQNHERGVLEFDRETKYTLADKKAAADLQKQTILSMGFNEDKDVDKDGKPDILEVAQHGLDAEITARKQDLDEKKFQHQKQVDKEKLKLDKEKNKNSK